MRVNKALEIIKGYCGKQIRCEYCRFADENENCVLRDYAPYDWYAPERKRWRNE